MRTLDTGREVAQRYDAEDPLAAYQELFVRPDPDLVYLDGNSLGRLPTSTAAALAEVVTEQWGHGLIRSWSQWIELSRDIGDEIASGVLDARPGEVLISDSTTVNLYKLAAAALDARPGRRVLVTDDDNFPTDSYVFQGLAAARDLELRVIETDLDTGLSTADVRAVVDEDVALVSFSHVAYRSGALADMGAVTEIAHAAGALTLWDLSHSAGSVPVPLTSAGVDLAVGCTYKYLCGGPGAPAFLYVRRELQDQLRQPIWGWFGQRDQFAMAGGYDPAPGIDRFLVGTPPVLSMVGVAEGVRLVARAGIGPLRTKGQALTAYLIGLADEWLTPLGFRLASPREADRRGAHVTLQHPDAWRICQALIERYDVIPDFRTPDRLRLGPAPLTTRYVDVWDGLDRLRRLVQAGVHEEFQAERGRVT
ncbi:aminotransferase class V-fold PLP-dependent enzyme [soil metagenome]